MIAAYSLLGKSRDFKKRINNMKMTDLLSFHRDNILVLDIFFEALNYETIEQKKAYEVAGLLGADLLSCIILFRRLSE